MTISSFLPIIAIAFSFWAGYEFADNSWQSRWDNQALTATQEKAKAEADLRTKEQLWQSKINEVQNNANDQINQMRSDIAAADNSANGLREQLQRLGKAASKTSCNSSATTPGQTASNTGLLLAELSARIDQRAGELARYADESRIAGAACENAYLSLSASATEVK